MLTNAGTSRSRVSRASSPIGGSTRCAGDRRSTTVQAPIGAATHGGQLALGRPPRGGSDLDPGDLRGSMKRSAAFLRAARFHAQDADGAAPRRDRQPSYKGAHQIAYDGRLSGAVAARLRACIFRCAPPPSSRNACATTRGATRRSCPIREFGWRLNYWSGDAGERQDRAGMGGQFLCARRYAGRVRSTRADHSRRSDGALSAARQPFHEGNAPPQGGCGRCRFARS